MWRRAATLLSRTARRWRSLHTATNRRLGRAAATATDPSKPGAPALAALRNSATPRDHCLFPQVPRRSMFIQTSITPNPNSVKFLPGTVVMENERTCDFPTFRAASRSPLARHLFQIDGVVGVMYGPDFITVSKREDVDWSVLRPEIFSVIMDFFTSGEALFPADADSADDAAAAGGRSDTEILETDPEHVAMIKELLETRIKPAVAEDGGSILYCGFEEETGTVLLEMQGACSSCSSSSVTLKNGVENMMRHYIPEVKAVREVKSPERQRLEAESAKMLADLERRMHS